MPAGAEVRDRPGEERLEPGERAVPARDVQLAAVAPDRRNSTLAPPGPLTVDDPNLQLHSAAELKAELEQGTERNWGDINPLKVLRTRK